MRAKAAAVATEKAVEMMKLTMFAAGVGTLEEIRNRWPIGINSENQ